MRYSRLSLLVALSILLAACLTAEAQTARVLEEAVQLHCKGQVAEAIVKYRQVAQESTDITEIKHARFAVGACQMSLEQYDAAKATFEAYAKDYPDDGYGPLAIVHAGNCLAEQGRLAEAAPYYEKALKMKQNKEDMVLWLGWAHLGMGKVLVNAGRYADALPQLENAITNASEVKVSTDAISLLLEALNNLEQAGGAGNDVAQAYFVLGKFYYDKRDYKQALPYVQRAVAAASDKTLLGNAYTILGETLQAVGRRDEASMAFQSAGTETTLNDDPESRALTAQTLRSCIDSGDHESVCRIGEAMQRDYPDDIATWGPALIHAYLDVAKPRYEKGIPVCKSIVERISDPKTVVDALTVLAECMYPLGRGAEAVAYQDDYYRRHPDRNTDADWVRARTAYYAEKDWAKAAGLLDAFISAYPKSDLVNTCREMLGDSLAMSGQTEKAKRAYAEAVAGAPDKTVAAKCAYKRAYASYHARDWAVARDGFQAVFDTYAGSAYQAGALYLVGECSVKLGDDVQARAALEGVVSKFADGEMAKAAAQLLSTLTGGAR